MTLTQFVLIVLAVALGNAATRISWGKLGRKALSYIPQGDEDAAN